MAGPSSLSLATLDFFLDEMTAATSLEAVHAATQAQIQSLGFEYFGYQLLMPTVGKSRHVFCTNKPKGWVLRYTEKRYISTDPVVRHSAISLRPFLWSQVAPGPNSRSASQHIFNEAGDFGLRAGGTVPIHGPSSTRALFSIAGQMPEEKFATLFVAERHALQIIGSYFHEHLMRLGVHNVQPPSVNLAPREREVMLWSARGKTAWEISEILAISEATVREYIAKACEKLGTNSKTHAVALAVLQSLIIP